MDDKITGITADLLIIDDIAMEELRTSSKALANANQGVIVVCHPEHTGIIELCEEFGIDTVLQTDYPNRQLTINTAYEQAKLKELCALADLAFRLSPIDEGPPLGDYHDYKVYHDPAPKKVPIKQAQRQSFRQSMRSVNRNR